MSEVFLYQTPRRDGGGPLGCDVEGAGGRDRLVHHDAWIYIYIYEGKLEHLLLSRYPSQRGPTSVWSPRNQGGVGGDRSDAT